MTADTVAPAPLPWESLLWRCEPSSLPFESTDELRDLPRVVGQERALEALRFGVGIQQPGFNLFALGEPGTGKRTLLLRFCQEKAERDGPASDWCYVHNFGNDNQPNALRLPTGRGPALRRDMERLVEDARSALESAFESAEYQSRREEVAEELKEQRERILDDIREKAHQKGLVLLRTTSGLVFVPAGKEGEALDSEALQALSGEQKEEIQKEIVGLQEELQRGLRQLPRFQKTVRQKLHELDREFADLAIAQLVEDLEEQYRGLGEVVDYLRAVRADMAEHAARFLLKAVRGDDEGADDKPKVVVGGKPPADGDEVLRRYRVNVLVDNDEAHGAPVVFEDNPTYGNLLGRLEHVARFGALSTDFEHIRAGALHRANGGYLMVEARKLLAQPFAWEGLKRALRSRQLRVESPTELQTLAHTVSLEPEPIPLEVKVALIGDARLYYLLSTLDPEFDELFKVVADFAETVARDDDGAARYAGMVARVIHEHGLRPFDRGAVARVLERSVRLAGDQAKLSASITEVEDLVREAEYRAAEAGAAVVDAGFVDAAVEARIRRSDRVRERILEEIERGRLLIDTEGAVVGQVNGLAVFQLGKVAFGRPSRITARVRMGEGEVLDIEREVKLGGPLHSKGVLILAGFLGERYGRGLPLSVAASLVFEQSYGGVDGDSASSAELYALLSAIAGIPLRQSFAVTGSVNQRGQVQAIGGVNEKIEGFFDVCRARGLSGEQGVLIPASNATNLMLRRDVVQAAREGRFRVFAVETIDQGLELLSGVPAGQVDEAGRFPEGSFNRRVHEQLESFATRRIELARAARAAREGQGDE